MADLMNGLIDSLRALQVGARELEREAVRTWPEPSEQLLHLKMTIAALGNARAASQAYCPEEYLTQWNEFIDKRRETLEPRALRFLCWEADISTNQDFQDYLSSNHVTLNSRALQGLVRSCHSRWSADFAAGQILRSIHDRLIRYKGPNRLLTHWKENSNVVLGPKGAEEFGARMVKDLRPIKEYCQSWALTNETCAYVQSAVRHATKLCRDNMDRVGEMRNYLFSELLPWSSWAPDVFKHEVSQVILHPTFNQSPGLKESIRQFVLSDNRLRDPRHAHNRLNWVGMDEAKRRVIEWQSQYDIGFFFESVLPQGKDPHGRKAFWLRYVSRIKSSRPLLNKEDKYRCQESLNQKERELLDFGSLDHQPGFPTSAFLLEFEGLLAVEFSAVNNALFLYQKNQADKIVPDFWTTKPHLISNLKQPHLCFEKRISHKVGWEEKAAQILARFGIRPS